MKTLKLFAFFFISATVFCQEINQTFDANELVSSAAFNTLIFNDLNFLVLGDNTPSQGFGSELNEDKTSLTVKGLLGKTKYGLITFDGTFSVDGGVYFFDENNGAKSSRFDVNFFKPISSSRSYDSPKNADVERAFIQNELTKRQEVYDVLSMSYKLTHLMEALNIPVKKVSNTEAYCESFKKELAKKYLSEYQIEPLTNEYVALHSIATELAVILPKKKYVPIEAYTINNVKAQDKSTYTIQKNITNVLKKKTPKPSSGANKKTTVDVTITITDQNDVDVATEVDPDKPQTPEDKLPNEIRIDIKKLIELYEVNMDKLEALEETLITKETTVTKKRWKGKHLPYWGVSLFYKRESADIFEYTEGVNFGKLFRTQRGDLFGGSLNGNYYFENKNNWFYTRLNAGIARNSNLGSFTKNTIENTTPITEEGETTSLNTVTQKVGYTNSSPYNYGFSSDLRFEFYYYWKKHFGLFAQVGHDGIYYDFKKDKINDSHVYPFRAGALLNLKTKKDAKNALTLQLFADRSDLSIDPTGSVVNPISDWRFGFQVGLPIYLRTQKKKP